MLGLFTGEKQSRLSRYGPQVAYFSWEGGPHGRGYIARQGHVWTYCIRTLVDAGSLRSHTDPSESQGCQTEPTSRGALPQPRDSALNLVGPQLVSARADSRLVGIVPRV